MIRQRSSVLRISVHDEIVKDAHGRACRLLEDRYASRAVKLRKFEDPSLCSSRGARPLLCRIRQTKAKNCYLSSQTSSMRQPLNRLFTMIVNPFTQGCQQVESRV